MLIASSCFSSTHYQCDHYVRHKHTHTHPNIAQTHEKRQFWQYPLFVFPHGKRPSYTAVLPSYKKPQSFSFVVVVSDVDVSLVLLIAAFFSSLFFCVVEVGMTTNKRTQKEYENEKRPYETSRTAMDCLHRGVLMNFFFLWVKLKWFVCDPSSSPLFPSHFFHLFQCSVISLFISFLFSFWGVTISDSFVYLSFVFVCSLDRKAQKKTMKNPSKFAFSLIAFFFDT